MNKTWILIIPLFLLTRVTFSQGLTTELVINEFLASNVSTIADQDGEYDDWVEIYNKGTVPVSLGGFNISDKPDNLDKWTFPDTTIDAGGVYCGMV